MKIVAITQARCGSTRLPGKVLKTINGKTLLEIHLERVMRSSRISKIIVATTIELEDGKVVAVANKSGVEVYTGSVNDVLERFYLAALPEKPDYVVRLTSDCPLVDFQVIDAIIDECVTGEYDYVSNTLEPTYPDGVDVEIFTFLALEKAFQQAVLKSDREHVTPYIWRNSSVKGGNMFKSSSVRCNDDYSKYRITVDTQEDFKLVEDVIIHLGTDKRWLDYVQYLNEHPGVMSMNERHTRNEGYQKSLKED